MSVKRATMKRWYVAWLMDGDRVIASLRTYSISEEHAELAAKRRFRKAHHMLGKTVFVELDYELKRADS